MSWFLGNVISHAAQTRRVGRTGFIPDFLTYFLASAIILQFVGCLFGLSEKWLVLRSPNSVGGWVNLDFVSYFWYFAIMLNSSRINMLYNKLNVV